MLVEMLVIERWIDALTESFAAMVISVLADVVIIVLAAAISDISVGGLAGVGNMEFAVTPSYTADAPMPGVTVGIRVDVLVDVNLNVLATAITALVAPLGELTRAR